MLLSLGALVFLLTVGLALLVLPRFVLWSSWPDVDPAKYVACDSGAGQQGNQSRTEFGTFWTREPATIHRSSKGDEIDAPSLHAVFYTPDTDIRPLGFSYDQWRSAAAQERPAISDLLFASGQELNRLSVSSHIRRHLIAPNLVTFVGDRAMIVENKYTRSVAIYCWTPDQTAIENIFGNELDIERREILTEIACSYRFEEKSK